MEGKNIKPEKKDEAEGTAETADKIAEKIAPLLASQIEGFVGLKQDLIKTYQESEGNSQRLQRLKNEAPGAFEKVREYCNKSRRQRIEISTKIIDTIRAVQAGESFEFPNKGVPLRLDKKNILADVEGREVKTSIGEICSDILIWGKDYSCPPGDHRGKYISLLIDSLRAIRSSLTLLRNEEAFVESWMPDNYHKVAPNLQLADVFQGFVGRESGRDRRSGLIAEDSVLAFLTRISGDYPELGYQIAQSTPVYDIKYKSDFILILKEGAKKRNIGIQLSTNLDQAVINKKNDQVEEARKKIKSGMVKGLKGIEFVVLPMAGFPDLVKYWKEHHPNYPGGPERFFDMEIRHDVFVEVMSKVHGHDKAEEMWNIIKDREEDHLFSAVEASPDN